MEHSFDSFLWPRSFGRFPAWGVVFLTVALFLASTGLGWLEYERFGTLFGYPLAISTLFVPFYEEMLFRGILFPALLRRNSMFVSIVIVSMFFGVWHAKNIFFIGPQRTLVQMLYTALLLSPIFCVLTKTSRSVWPAIVLHQLVNLSVIVRLLL